MDTELSVAKSHLTGAGLVLRHRHKRLENTRSRMSRHYNRLQHTDILISLIEEILGLIEQDPDMWDDNPDIVPF